MQKIKPLLAFEDFRCQTSATFEDVELFAAHVGPNVKIKAAGGMGSIADAEKFMALGADRLGTSRIVKIVKDN